MELKKNSLAAGIIGLVTIIVVIGIAGYFVSRPKPVAICGEAEANEYRVSGKVPGRIEELYVREGDYVRKGDTVVFINSPEVMAKLAQVSALKAAAVAQSTKAQNGAQKEMIEGAYQMWQTALVQQEVMRKSFERIQRLYNEKVVTAQKYDEVKAKYDASVTQANAGNSQYDLAVAGARVEDKEAAAAVVNQAEGALMEVQGYLAELYLVAPCDGIVSAVYPKEGELVGQGAPVMSITDMNDIWFTFNVREDRLHGIKRGDVLTLAVPALDGQTVQAKVTYMAARESYATWRATKDTDSYDAKTFEVRAVPETRTEGLLPGMTVIVK
ncbi:MAG: efflux RND transporter periplasmic adaptor subunit [Bacteroidales bacterium]|nr:efflux RND transporter periplasmic adaptor subunit [Bacteroidales bacterium]